MVSLREAAQQALEFAVEIDRGKYKGNAEEIRDALRAALSAETEINSQLDKLAAASGFTRRPSLWALEAREVLQLIAAPMRPDGTWNRDREACRQLAADALAAQPEPAAPTVVEPVAWIRQRDNKLALSDGGVFGDDWTPLYTHPPRTASRSKND